MKAAVVGAGDISAIHLAALDSLGIEVAAVVDHDGERAAAAARPRGARAVTDLRDALADVDVVHVCTPHDQHLPVVLAAIEAGRHVLTEKPLAHRLGDAERVAEAAAGSVGKVGVVLQNRYNPTSRAMKETLESGALGAVRSATATVVWSRPEPYYAHKRWAGERVHAGGGALINQSIHTIDLVQWFLGPVTQVRGRAFRLEPIDGVDVEDTATFTMTHATDGGPVPSIMWATNAHAVNDPVTIDIVCERGTLALRGDLVISGPDGVRTVADTPADPAAPSYWGASHEALIGDFYHRLDEPGPFWINPDTALAAQRILTEVYAQSA